jgi:hypothetical protein
MWLERRLASRYSKRGGAIEPVELTAGDDPDRQVAAAFDATQFRVVSFCLIDDANEFPVGLGAGRCADLRRSPVSP